MKDNELLAMLKTALEMEERGYKFYDDATNKVSNEQVKRLFEKLRDEEIIHVERIKKIFAQIDAQGEWHEDFSTYQKPERGLDKIFRELSRSGAESASSEIEAIEIATDLEQKAVSFYERHVEKAKSPIEKAFLTAMVAEERSHFQALRAMKLFLENPSAFYEELEKSHLDGG